MEEYNSLFSNNRENEKIEKLFIKYLRKQYFPKFKQELGENASPNEIENAFQQFLTKIKSTGLMDQMMQSFYEKELNRKMSGLSFNN